MNTTFYVCIYSEYTINYLNKIINQKTYLPEKYNDLKYINDYSKVEISLEILPKDLFAITDFDYINKKLNIKENNSSNTRNWKYDFIFIDSNEFEVFQTLNQFLIVNFNNLKHLLSIYKAKLVLNMNFDTINHNLLNINIPDELLKIILKLNIDLVVSSNFKYTLDYLIEMIENIEYEQSDEE